MRSKPTILHLLFLYSFASCGAVIITPALPDIAKALSISKGEAQSFMSLFLVGYVIAQLFYGPVGHHYGFSMTMKLSALLGVLSTILTFVSVAFGWYVLALVGRVLLAFASGAGLKIALAYTGRDFAPEIVPRISAWLWISIAIAPSLCIYISGLLTNWLEWQGALGFEVVYSVLMFFVCLTLPKDPLQKARFNIVDVMRHYKEHFKAPRLILTGLMMGIPTAYMYIFTTDAPFIAIDTLKMTPATYGLFYFFVCGGTLIGGVLGYFFNIRFSSLKMIVVSLILTSIISIGYFIALLYVPMNGWWLFAPIGIAYITLTLLASNAAALALAHGENKSYISAIANFVDLSCVFVIILLLTIFNSTTFLVYGLFLIGTLVIGWLLYFPLSYLVHHHAKL